MQPILKIDLTESQITHFDIPKPWLEKYLGGASLAARLLYDVITPDLDPLSENAVLLFLNGPLSGTAGPTLGRFVICGKSPATGLWAESNIGGFWGPELRKAGYLGVWITGRAEKPVYISIQDGEVNINSASHLWGLDTYEIQDVLREELGKKLLRVAGIGVAGENQVSFANILCDHGRVAGRTGLGAVMGSKNLKAVAVSGSGEIPVFDPSGYSTVRTRLNKQLKNDTVTKSLRELGTAGAIDYFDYIGSMPKKYFSKGIMDGVYQLSGASIEENYGLGVSACHACVVACGRVIRKPENNHKQKGPEYETIAGFGPNLWIDDPEFIFDMSDLCDRYGLDTISTSGVIGFVFTLFELGILTIEDTGGLVLHWGNKSAVRILVEQIALRTGIGDELAKGVRALGDIYQASEHAIQVNGLELPYHDPRGISGMALVYTTSPRGACHNQSDYYLAEIGQVEEDLGMQFYERHVGAEKAQNVVIHQNWRAIFNSLVMCIFGNISPEQVLEVIQEGCGYRWSIDQLLLTGERGWNLKRAINNRLGLGRVNDTLPKPLRKALENGGAAGYEIPFDEMLRAYYQTRSWDWNTGFPTKDKLSELDLGFVVKNLWGNSE